MFVARSCFFIVDFLAMKEKKKISILNCDEMKVFKKVKNDGNLDFGMQE